MVDRYYWMERIFATCPLHTLRNSIQPIQQDVFLFRDTILNNMTLGRDVPFERVQDMAALAQADAFIRRLPEQYETVMLDGGSNLSGGQRQLIAFARALIHNPPVLILDEATAHVDTETERLIQKGMRELLRNRTSLVIAHRLSTIQDANRIMVMARGQLVELGSHAELLEKRGIYYNLYRYQYAQLQ